MKPTGSLARRIVSNSWEQVLLVLFSFLCLFPLYHLIVTAFKSQGEYIRNLFGIPLGPILSNFATVFRGGLFLRWFANSLLLTAGSVLAALAIALAAAWAFAKMEFRIKGLVAGAVK